jgi:hypothetical protein
MLAIYKQFSQGISVAICAAMSTGTLGYMMLDSHKMEKKQIRSDYEKQIKVLNEEIEKLKMENAEIRVNYSEKLNLKY